MQITRRYHQSLCKPKHYLKPKRLKHIITVRNSSMHSLTCNYQQVGMNVQIELKLTQEECEKSIKLADFALTVKKHPTIKLQMLAF